MTKEDKELLLKDLCARLPYGVILNTPNGDKPLLALTKSLEYKTIICCEDYCGNENNIKEWLGGDVEFIKPYLRPMSSMTEKEKREFQSFFPGSYGNQWLDIVEGAITLFECNSTMTLYISDNTQMVDWLNARHFDYRGLIEKGLALEAPEGMYK